MKFQDRSLKPGLDPLKLVPRVFLPLTAIVAACTPDLNGPPTVSNSNTVIVEFDPSATVPVVPAPNDLAKSAATGKLVVPSAADASDAQKEFNTDYLGNLTGFPFETSGSATTSGALDPASVTANSVVVIDVAAATAGGFTPDAIQKARVSITPTFANNTITIPPPGGAWTRGKTYAVVLVAGSTGLKGASGQQVQGSQTWALVSAEGPLVACTDQAKFTGCKPTVDIIPSDVEDPSGKLADQTTKAIQLEQLRLGYKPILDAMKASGIQRDAIPLAWTFSIVDAGEVTFDPANSVIPFPNDAVRTGAQDSVSKQAKVTLPNPKTGKPLTDADCAAAAASGDSSVSLYCGLNTLDGFSTLAPLVSENSDKAGAVVQANIAASSLTAQTVGLARLTSSLPAAAATALQTSPQFTPCLNCTSSSSTSGVAQTSPQQLQWRLDAPLDERTTYAGYVTTEVKDDQSKNVVPNPVFALVRSKASLLTSDGKSAVSILTDDNAKALEPLRVAYKPVFDALDAAGVPRSKLALGFPFTTQSEGSVLDQLAVYPAQVTQIPDLPPVVTDVTTVTNAKLNALVGPSNHPAVGNSYAGYFLTPVAVTGPGGTLNPTAPEALPVPFIVLFPSAAALSNLHLTQPTGVTIFGHGLTRSRNDVLAIANAINGSGQIVIATDVIDHGDRTSCTGTKLVSGQTSDDASCSNPSTMKCDEDAILGLCVLRDSGSRMACTKGPGVDGDGKCAAAGQGRCAADNFCQGAGADLVRDAGGLPTFNPGTASAAVFSGWNIFSLSNFFATRDNFRQQVIDLSKLVRVLKATDTGNLGQQVGGLSGGNDVLVATNINYVGQSLGGILGTLFNSVSPDTTNVVLNVPGGALPQIILQSPSFNAQKAALLAGLAAIGLTQGTPAFDQFINTVQWILDPADPANVGYRLTHAADTGTGVTAPNANRKAFIQFIEGDQTVINVSNFALVTGANRTFVTTPPSFGCQAPLFCYEFTEAGDNFNATNTPPANRHGFLLNPPRDASNVPNVALTVKAQTQAATFLATGNFQ